MKIAIIRLSALGDIIQTAIILQFIKKFNPSIEIHWFVDERFKQILQNHPHIDKLYALPLKDKKFFTSLKIVFQARKNNYNAVLDFQGLIKSALVSRLLSRNAFGFDKDSLKESLAANFYNQKLHLSYNENVFVRYLNLASFALNSGFEPKDILHKQDVFFADKNLKENLKNALNLNPQNKNILIHVGSSELNKIYPKEHLSLLCQSLLALKNTRIFLAFGNEKEKEFANEVLKMSGKNGIELLNKLNLQELIALTKLMNLVIGNDSGPTHLAFALNVPSITIFGATPSKRNAFTTQINKTINSGKENIDQKKLDKNDFCITQIKPEDIFQLARKLLDDK